MGRPEQLLITLKGLLKPGSLLLFAPRYDFPFYLSSSSIDIHAWKKILLSFRLLMIRLITVLRGAAWLCYGHQSRMPRSPVLARCRCHSLGFGPRTTPVCTPHNLAFFRLDVSHQAPSLSKQGVIDRFCKLAVHLQRLINSFLAEDLNHI